MASLLMSWRLIPRLQEDKTQIYKPNPNHMRFLGFENRLKGFVEKRNEDKDYRNKLFKRNCKYRFSREIFSKHINRKKNLEYIDFCID